MGVKKQGVPVKIPNLSLQCAARFYIGSSSLCSRYRMPSAPLQHRHEALFADIALHEIIVCGKQEAAPVLQPRHGVEHEIVLVAARNAEEADFHRLFPEEQRRILIRFAVQSAQFMQHLNPLIFRRIVCLKKTLVHAILQQIAENHRARHVACRFQFTDVVKKHHQAAL